MSNNKPFLQIIISFFFVFAFQHLHAQCACVWTNALGVKQCVLYPNCSSGFENSCKAQISGSPALCSSGSDCYTYPGSTPGCSPVCFANGACWYQGTSCQANTVCITILPIGLIDLKGVRVDDYNFLSWRTAFETNNDYFVVLRSIDGINWEEMVRLEGAGTSTNTVSYELKDMEPEVGVNYYKIAQIDYNGESASFGPISIDNSSKPRTLVKTVNVLGQEVNLFSTGFVFNCYDDGSTEKVLR